MVLLILQTEFIYLLSHNSLLQINANISHHADGMALIIRFNIRNIDVTGNATFLRHLFRNGYNIGDWPK